MFTEWEKGIEIILLFTPFQVMGKLCAHIHVQAISLSL